METQGFVDKMIDHQGAEVTSGQIWKNAEFPTSVFMVTALWRSELDESHSYVEGVMSSKEGIIAIGHRILINDLRHQFPYLLFIPSYLR